jgi:hypothetical protein
MKAVFMRQPSNHEVIMIPRTWSTLSRITGFAALLAGAAFAEPARAEGPLSNFGPVGPREPVLVTVGHQRVIAFYEPERGACAVNAIMWKDEGADAPFASSRVRFSLRPGEMFRVDAAGTRSMNLLCGADADSLAVVAPVELTLTTSQN